MNQTIHAERFPAIPPEQWTEEQKKVATAIASGPRGEVRGPFLALMRSPGLAQTVQQVGEYLRFKCPLDRRIAEMATLIAARHWTQQYEWQSHYKHAMKAGLSPAIAQAIAEGRRPQNMAADEEALYDMLTEVLHNHGVSDSTYGRALIVFLIMLPLLTNTVVRTFAWMAILGREGASELSTTMSSSEPAVYLVCVELPISRRSMVVNQS